MPYTHSIDMNWIEKLTLIAEDLDRFCWLVTSSNAAFPLPSRTSLSTRVRPCSRGLRLATRVTLQYPRN